MSDFDQGNEHGGAAVLEERSPVKVRRPHAPTEFLPSVSFPLPSSRLGPCVVKLVSAALLGGLSAFLIAEIPHTPGLMTNIIILSSVGAMGAAALAILAFRDAVCRLVVDDRGIRITPFPFGQSIDWPEIASWRMSDEPDEYADSRRLMVWVHGASFPRLIAIGKLSREARRSLRKTLHARLGDES